jgi:hypothetical protein
MEKSPAEVLGAIIDEVEGLRRTDARSFLPESLLREAKMALEDSMGDIGTSSQLSDIHGLVGRTVSHVFDCYLKRADVVIVCTDGAYLALDTEQDGEGHYVGVDSYGFYSRNTSGIAAYLQPAALVEVGLMTKAEQERIEREEKAEKLRAQLRRNEEAAANARKALELLGAS